MDRDVSVAAALLFTAAMVIVYFAPWLTAWGRDHRQTVPIFVLNLFLGWTLVGWVAALVWACTRASTTPPAPQPSPTPTAATIITIQHGGQQILINTADGTASVDGINFATPADAQSYIDRLAQMGADNAG